MREWIVKILICVLCITLCVNFVRFVVQSSTWEGQQSDFMTLDPFYVLDVVSELDAPTDVLFSDLFETVKKLGEAGQAFAEGLDGSKNITGTWADKILGFFSGLFGAVVGFIEFLGQVINVAISLILWEFDLLKLIYKLLNAVLGTSFGA